MRWAGVPSRNLTGITPRTATRRQYHQNRRGAQKPGIRAPVGGMDQTLPR